eukprot:TRINITY_DN2244_c0_g2_i1.p1 TRINITY_DN2244_c0_g2~~TRINITY_DN2244_c0_g2_i1.p1  ORF type:complete len:319 (+),score=97.79 TRINITY_DN2244_c0_g2_i1:254-1210(+)
MLSGEAEIDALFLSFVTKWHEEREDALDLLYGGLPPEIRAPCWQLISRSCELMQQNSDYYQKLLQTESKYDSNIQQDITRTLPYMEDIFDEEKQTIVSNILHAYSVYDDLIGYAQGMNYIVTIITFLLPEEHAFWLALRLFKGYALEKLYPSKTISIIEDCFIKFEAVLESYFPQLFNHLYHKLGLSSPLYLPKWFQTCFLYSQRPDLSIRIMDIVLVHGMEALFRVALALMDISRSYLLDMTFIGNAIDLLKNLDPEVFPEDEVIEIALHYPPDFLDVKPRRVGINQNINNNNNNNNNNNEEEEEEEEEEDLDCIIS